jgi:ketosteroid isomerase-like protein
MSQENVDFAKSLFAAADGMDKQALLAVLPEFIEQTCDPEIEWIEDPQRAGGRVYCGHRGVRESWEQWLDQWEDYGFEIERIAECGEAVLAVAREHGRGTTSGAAVSARNFMVITSRDGRILRYQEFYDKAQALRSRRPGGVGRCRQENVDRAEALEAVGLSEQDARADS